MYRSRFALALAMAALAAILLPSSLHAQITFQRTYGGVYDEYGYSVQQTTDGGYVIAGYTTLPRTPYNFDVYLVKTDSIGDTLWTVAIGDTFDDVGYSVQQTADGGYIVTGGTNLRGARYSQAYLIKTDVSGDTLWTRTFGGVYDDNGSSVQQTADSGYIIAGYTASYGAGGNDVYLIKTDANGDTLWTRTFGGAYGDIGYSVQQTTDSGYIIVGYTESFGAGQDDVYLIKTDDHGTTLWTRIFGGTDADWGSSVRQTSDGGYVIAGSTFSFGAGASDVYLIKTDTNGDTLWTKTIGGTDADYGMSIQETSDGGCIIAGRTTSFSTHLDDVYLVRTDANGDTLWTKIFGGRGWNEGYSVQQTIDKGYVIAGLTTAFGAGQYDVYLIKTDTNGYVAVAEPKASPTRASDLTIACQPNPASGATTIRLSPFALRHSPLTLHVYDSQGCLVRSVLGIRNSSFPLDLRALPSGAYFVRVDDGNEHATARLVLQH